MPENARVTAVVPVHNRADLLRRMLETAAAQTRRFTEIIVVDNASQDGAPAVAREFGCRVLAMGANAGFARAVNTGWKAAGSEWIAILNSDVELDPGWLDCLLRRSEDSKTAFATGLILAAHDRTRIDGSYDLVSRAGCAWRAGSGAPASQRPPASRIAIAPGTACLFRRDALEALGGYDENFESYLEDVDLGLRCVRAGLSGVFAPEALAWHHGSATLGRWNARVVRLISRNQALLIAKHYDARMLLRNLWPVIAGQLLWGLVAARHGAFFAWAAGKWEALRRFRLAGAASAELEIFLSRSEAEIQHRAHDPYWRCYFLFAGRRGGAH